MGTSAAHSVAKERGGCAGGRRPSTHGRQTARLACSWRSAPRRDTIGAPPGQRHPAGRERNVTKRLGTPPRRRTQPPPPPQGPAPLTGPPIPLWTAHGPATLRLPDGTLVAAMLPAGATGLYAITHADGTLARLGRQANGSDTGWQLHLYAGEARGRAVLRAGSGGSADVEVYQDGESERYDAWSDNSRPTPVDSTWTPPNRARVVTAALQAFDRRPLHACGSVSRLQGANARPTRPARRIQGSFRLNQTLGWAPSGLRDAFATDPANKQSQCQNDGFWDGSQFSCCPAPARSPPVWAARGYPARALPSWRPRRPPPRQRRSRTTTATAATCLL